MPVPYPVACSPQAWAAGVVVPVPARRCSGSGARRPRRAGAAPPAPARLAGQGHADEPPGRRRVGRPAVPPLARDDAAPRCCARSATSPSRSGSDGASRAVTHGRGAAARGRSTRLTASGSEIAPARRRAAARVRGRRGPDGGPRPSRRAGRGGRRRRPTGSRIERRAAGEPVAYIRGHQGVLRARLHRRRAGADPAARDGAARRAGRSPRSCTGWPRRRGRSASPPVRVARRRDGQRRDRDRPARRAPSPAVPSTEVTVLATDSSPDALDLARENAVGHAVADTLSFLEADLLPPVDRRPVRHRPREPALRPHRRDRGPAGRGLVRAGRRARRRSRRARRDRAAPRPAAAGARRRRRRAARDRRGPGRDASSRSRRPRCRAGA